MLGAKRTEQRNRFGSAFGEPREEKPGLLRMVQPLGEFVDVADHGAEHVELRPHAGIFRRMRQMPQTVQYGGERVVLGAQDADGLVHSRTAERSARPANLPPVSPLLDLPPRRRNTAPGRQTMERQ